MANSSALQQTWFDVFVTFFHPPSDPLRVIVLYIFHVTLNKGSSRSKKSTTTQYLLSHLCVLQVPYELIKLKTSLGEINKKSIKEQMDEKTKVSINIKVSLIPINIKVSFNIY